MAKSSKIRVMISSRCKDTFPLRGKDRVRLTELRIDLKKEIENSETLGNKIYEVWVHEDAAASAERDSWEECMREARECDIFLMLYNGNAGWKGSGEFASVGICDAEFQTAYAAAPSKVTIVDIFERDSALAPSEPHHRAFQARLDRENIFGARPANPSELKSAIKRAVAVRTIELTQKGVLSSRQGRGYLGPALDWKRLSYSQRSDRMVKSVVSALNAEAANADAFKLDIDGKAVLCRPAAIPDALSVSAARELVGQPHLSDHTYSAALKNLYGGPIHLIACLRGATEAQAQRMLGFSNATVVPAPFGVYVIDPVQAIQLVLIANCSDEHATRLGIQRFMEWLPQSGQLSILVRTAKKRKDIVTLLATGA